MAQPLPENFLVMKQSLMQIQTLMDGSVAVKSVTTMPLAMNGCLALKLTFKALALVQTTQVMKSMASPLKLR